MRIFGLDITKPLTTAEKKPKSIKGASREELGDSGTEVTGGYVYEEYNTKLRTNEGIKKFDEMRKSDGTVRAAVLSTSLPIRRARWYVEPATEDKADQEIAQFIESALFEFQTITWQDLLRQALLMLPFGVMVFEKVFEVRTVDGKDRIIWRKFAPRMPKSIQKWELDNGESGIQQLKSNGDTVEIPIDKLCIFVNEKEGDNWWGTSILRPAYKHWYFKNHFYHFQGVAYERQAVGIPKAKLQDGYSPQDEAKAIEVVQNLRAHHSGYVIEPPNIEIEIMDMKGMTTKDPEKAIAHHNREIAKSVLAQFLELGVNNSGSRALSSDQSELFLQSLESVAASIADAINNYAIKQLVDLNFDGVEYYPQLKFAGISRVDAEKLSTAYQRLTQTGALKPGKGDEQYFRELLSLPDREDDEEVPQEKKPKDKKQTKDVKDDVGLSELIAEFKKKTKITNADRATIKAVFDKEMKGMKFRDRLDFIEQALKIVGKKKDQPKIYNEIEALLNERSKEMHRLIFKQVNNYESWRALTFAEKKVNFESINDRLDKMEAEFELKATQILSDAKDKYVKQLNDLLQKNDSAGIKTLTLQAKTEYKVLLKTAMADAFQFGKSGASREMGVTTPANPNEVMTRIDITADNIATKHIADLVYEAKKEMVTQLENGVSKAQTIGAIDLAMTNVIKKVLKPTASIIMAGSLNDGRNTVFEKNANKIYALQRSEILDKKTCNFCLSMDGRIIELKDPLAKRGIFHSYCRGIWVEILEDEEDKPKISGVPESLRSRVGDAVNDLIQPKKPIVKKNSLAKNAIDKGKAGK